MLVVGAGTFTDPSSANEGMCSRFPSEAAEVVDTLQRAFLKSQSEIADVVEQQRLPESGEVERSMLLSRCRFLLSKTRRRKIGGPSVRPVVPQEHVTLHGSAGLAACLRHAF